MEAENELIRIWKSIIVGSDKSWVLFAHGTCVILVKPETNLAEQAVELMMKNGQVHVGSYEGDFGTIKLANVPGYVVTCHHPDILTYIFPNDLGSDKLPEVGIGLLGRSKRDQDALELHIIHVEDKRRRE